MALFNAVAAVQAVEVEKLNAPEKSCAPPESSGLVLRAQAGDTCAFEQLMVRHQRQVLCTAARILRRYEDAKDVAQEVFLKLYRYLPRIRPKSVRSWLYQVTINACRDVANKGEKFPDVCREQSTKAGTQGRAGSVFLRAPASLRSETQSHACFRRSLTLWVFSHTNSGNSLPK